MFLPNRYIYIIAWLLLPVHACIAQLKPVNDISIFQQLLATGNAKLETIECDFVQYKQMEMMVKPIVSSGKFYYKHPEMICLDYTQPAPSRITLNGDLVKMEMGGKTNLYNSISNPMAASIKSMFNLCLFGDLGNSTDNYQITVLENELIYQVEITPTNRKMKKYIRMIEIVFEKKDFTVNVLMMKEPSGDYTQYDFNNKKINQPLSDKIFQIK